MHGRAQADRKLYREAMQAAIAATDNLDVLAQPVDDVLIEDGRCVGIVTADGAALRAAAVVLTTGTFLDGLVHIGTQRIPAGRHGEALAVTLSKRLYALAEESGALSLGRMKTGTPARLDGRTINTDILEAQPADAQPVPFSFMTDKITCRKPFAISPTPTRQHLILSRKTSNYRRSIRGRLTVSGRAIVQPLKIRWCAFPTASRIKYFWNRRGWMIRRFTPMAFPPHCPRPFKTPLSAPFRAGKCPYYAARLCH